MEVFSRSQGEAIFRSVMTAMEAPATAAAAVEIRVTFQEMTEVASEPKPAQARRQTMTPMQSTSDRYGARSQSA